MWIYIRTFLTNCTKKDSIKMYLNHLSYVISMWIPVPSQGFGDPLVPEHKVSVTLHQLTSSTQYPAIARYIHTLIWFYHICILIWNCEISLLAHIHLLLRPESYSFTTPLAMFPCIILSNQQSLNTFFIISNNKCDKLYAYWLNLHINNSLFVKMYHYILWSNLTKIKQKILYVIYVTNRFWCTIGC